MSITAEHEGPAPPTSPGFSDAITFTFGDPERDVFAIARVGLSGGEDGVTHGSGLAVVFAGGLPVAVRAAGAVPVADRAFESIDVAGVRAGTVAPLREWTLRFTAEDRSVALDLGFTAVSEPAAVPAGSPVHSTGGMQGYEQLCRVSGTATVNGRARTVDCLGQRGHSWGVPDWDRLALVRSVSAWVGEDLGVALTAVRTAKARDHADEAIHAAVFMGPDPESGDAPATVVVPEDSRLSTTYDGEGRQLRAGLELYEHEDGYPHRGAGEVLCGTSLDLGPLRLDCAFLHWRLDGREGVGRYDILRRNPCSG